MYGDVFFNVKLSLELQNANSCLMHLAGKIIDKHELIIHATRPAIGQIFIIQYIYQTTANPLSHISQTTANPSCLPHAYGHHALVPPCSTIIFAFIVQ